VLLADSGSGLKNRKNIATRPPRAESTLNGYRRKIVEGVFLPPDSKSDRNLLKQELMACKFRGTAPS